MSTPEFLLDDILAEDDFFGGVSSRRVRSWLAANGTAKTLTVRINSPGGSATEGCAIYSALKRHGAKVIVEVEGLAASAASVVAMAGDEIHMHRGSLMMVHEAWSMTFGTADDLRKSAGVLQKVNGEMADLYAARTKQTRASILQMMAEETWLTADEALQKGFATHVLPAKAAPAPVARAQAAQALMASYKRMPSGMRPAAQASATGRPSIGELAHAPAPSAPGVPTWRGSTFEELQPTEKALLKRQDAQLFAEMRTHYSRKNKTFAQLTGPERAALRSVDAAKYARMRDGSAETWKPRLVEE